MGKKEWFEPSIEVMNFEVLEKLASKVLTIESSLYASGCHGGMYYSK